MDGVCKLLHINNIENINSKDIGSIISSEYKNYSKMKALGCLINYLISINKFPVSKIGFIGEGSAGLANLVDGFGGSAKLVDKKNDKQKDTDNEYLVGTQLNVLRQYTPCFSYVFGKSENSVIYEYGGHMSLHMWRSENPNNIGDLLTILLQVLLSLYISQRKYNFMHNDLHGSNIIIRDKRDSYTLIVGDTEYRFNNVLVPCIIDYGLSYIEIGDEYVPEYNGKRRQLFVQGFDPCFMLSDCAHSNYGIIKDTTRRLFKEFYKTPLADNFVFENLYRSIDATTTPLDLAIFILKSGRLSQITMSKRNVYIEQKPENMGHIYTKLLGVNSYTLDSVDCGGFKSFIISKYFKFSDNAKYEGLENDRRALTETLELFKNTDPNSFLAICKIVLDTKMAHAPALTDAQIDLIYNLAYSVNMFGVMYYMSYEMRDVMILPLLPILDTGKATVHFANGDYYNRVVGWLTTLGIN